MYTGWDTKTQMARAHRTASKRHIAKRMGISRETFRRATLMLPWYCCRVRHGLCDYCLQWRNKERPKTARIIAGLFSQLHAMGSTLEDQWREQVALNDDWAKPEFEPESSPSHLNKMQEYLNAHAGTAEEQDMYGNLFQSGYNFKPLFLNIYCSMFSNIHHSGMDLSMVDTIL